MYHAVGIEDGADGLHGGLHAFDPAARYAVLAAIVKQRDDFLFQQVVDGGGEEAGARGVAGAEVDALDQGAAAVYEEHHQQRGEQGVDALETQVLAQVEAGEGNTRFDLLSVTLDEIRQCLEGEKSKKYNKKQLNNLADFFLLLPQDLAFSVLKDLALNNDINDRLLLNRDDLFAILKAARKGDIG